MNVPVEILQLQEFLWSQVHDATRREQTVSAITSLLGELARGTWLPLTVALLLLLLVPLLYQPRIPRGALWVPAFGIFGHSPKFYTHTRPASFCGVFLQSRHRVATRRHRRSSRGRAGSAH